MGRAIDEGPRGLIPPPLDVPPRRRRRRRRVVHHAAARRHRRRKRFVLWILGAILGVLVLGALVTAVYAGPAALRAARDGRRALTGAADSFVQRDVEGARRGFSRAKSVFATAESRLGSPLTWPSRLVPVLNRHVRLAHALAEIGRTASDAGLRATAAMQRLPGRELKMVDGRVDLPAVRRAAATFGGLGAADEIRARAERLPKGWVLGPLDAARREALENLPKAVDGVRKGKIAVDALPSLFAENGRKRYVIAFSNLAELRGSGGFIGYVTVLKAESGDLDLEDVSGRPTDLFPPPGEANVTFPDWFPEDFRTQATIFQNINLTTDFPTVGRLIVATASSAIGRVDGVIGVDPVGIGAVLTATGPVSVPSWPGRITAENVSRIAQHDVYRRIENDDARQEFFSQLVRTAFDKLTTIDVRLRPATFGAFDRAVRAGHFRMFSSNSDDQATFEALGLAGGVDRARGATDVLSVVSVNATGNKGDWFLSRQLRYRVRLHPERGVAEGELRGELRNEAPPGGLPDYIIGSPLPGLPEGTNRQILLFLRPRDDLLRTLAIDGVVKDPEKAAEGSLVAYRSSADVPARSSVGLRLSSKLADAFGGTGRKRTYRLHVLPQPTVNADRYTVDIDPPKGWQIEGRTHFDGPLTDDVVLEVELTQDWRAWAVDRLFRDPWRAARELIARIF